MKRLVFGEPITAIDVERLPADEGPTDFVRLCGGLIARALSGQDASLTLPEISERINVPDGGVDARYVAPADLIIPETSGLVGPGTTIYQFKYRDVAQADRATIVRRLQQTLREELGRTLPESDRYVLMTNVNLSGSQARRLRDVVIGSLSGAHLRTVVVWGATEIAIALNLAPSLRHIFFTEGGLCSLDTVQAELQAAYGRLGWSPFIDRAAELGAIAAFLQDPATKFLRVVGPRYVGKTRLVLEGLKSHGASVLWASEPHDASLDLFRELESYDERLILVVDGCDQKSLATIQDRALGRRHLKTVAISVGHEAVAERSQPGVLAVQRFGYQDAAKLIENIAPRMAFLQQSWVTEAAGGLPGLVAHVAALLRDGEISSTSDVHDLHRRLGHLIEDRYVSQLATPAVRALEVAALLPVVGVHGAVRKELEAVCRALGLTPADFDSELRELQARGLVRVRGRFIEVVPPRLAEELASRVLSRENRLIAELQLALDPSAFIRFLERLRNSPDDHTRVTIEGLLSSIDWFADLESLKRNIWIFRTLAPAAPRAALRRLEALLGGCSSDQLRAQLADDHRRAIVSVLDDLTLRTETFTGAAKLLLALADAENETWSNNATGVFVHLFHWDHREIPAPLSIRLEVLQIAAVSKSPRQRAIAARACGSAFVENGLALLHESTGPELPEGPYRPSTWEEVREYGLGIFRTVQTLRSEKEPSEVEDAAIASMLDSLRPFVVLSLLSDRLHELGSRVLEAVIGAGRVAKNARRRGAVVSRLEFLLNELEQGKDADATAARSIAIARLKGGIEELTTGTIKDQLWRWVGSRSWATDFDEEERRRGEALRSLASTLLENPDDFVANREWLLGDEPEHRLEFFQTLGNQDQGRKLYVPLLEGATSTFWPQAVGAYFRGWHEADARGAEGTLDALIESRALNQAALAATLYLPVSDKTAARLLRIVTGCGWPRSELARQIALGLSWEAFTAESVQALMTALDDGSRETRSALLPAFWLRIARSAQMPPELLELAWRFLATATPTIEGSVDRSWDTLAAQLGKYDVQRLVGLTEQLLRSRVDRRDARFDPGHELPLTWRFLQTNGRSAFLRALLGFSLEEEAPYWVHWSLSKLVDPAQDLAALVEFTEAAGISGAYAVANIVEAGKPGFWELARTFLSRWGQDERLKSRLSSRVFSGAWAGSAVPMIEDRKQRARTLTSDREESVASWARDVVARLEKWRESAEREDSEEWIWDQPMSHADLEQLLTRRDSPERLWAIGRLLKDAPHARVLELLSPAEILDALPKLPQLDERTRQMWEGYARQWSGRN